MIAIPQGYTLCQTAKALFKAFDRYIDGDEVDCVVVYCGSFILSVSTGLNVRLWVFTVLFVRNVVSVLLESVVVVLGEFVLITKPSCAGEWADTSGSESRRRIIHTEDTATTCEDGCC